VRAQNDPLFPVPGTPRELGPDDAPGNSLPVLASPGADQKLSAFPLLGHADRMTLDPDQEELFTEPSPPPDTVFVNERVSFQTEDQQRMILVHGVVFAHYSPYKIARLKPTLWSSYSNPDMPIRTTWPVVSVTRLAPCVASRGGSNPED
jgi:hypothetical protein